MFDLKVIETQNGGDLVFKGKDLEIVRGWQNMPYLDMFGGNKESSTKQLNEGEQAFDWWGNVLFLQQTPEIQYNSQLERILDNVALTSSSRLLIEQAINSDLSNFDNFSTVSLNVSIVSTDRLSIVIRITEPDNLESDEFIYIWDNTKKELLAS